MTQVNEQEFFNYLTHFHIKSIEKEIGMKYTLISYYQPYKGDKNISTKMAMMVKKKKWFFFVEEYQFYIK